MGYIEKHLAAGERVVYRARLYPFVVGGLVPLILLPVTLMLVGVQSAGQVILLMVLCFLAYNYLIFKSAEFGVTTSRVIAKWGLLRRRSLELQLNKVESVTLMQPIFGRILNYGTVIIGGTGGTKETFRYIADPIRFRNSIQEQIGKVPQAVRAHDDPKVTPIAATSAAHRVERECPYCAEVILAKARVCKHCGRDIALAS